MKLKKENFILFFWLSFCFFLVGGLFFEILGTMLPDLKWFFQIGIPKIGFDLKVIQFSLKVNLGSIAGFITGVIIFYVF